MDIWEEIIEIGRLKGIMNILVSSCLLGCNCKYNGKNNLNKAVVDFVAKHNVISVCPEILAGMSCPRPCAEIVQGIVMDENGKNIDEAYRKGVALALEKISNQNIDLAILQSRSPTCGVNEIYDGTFTGTLIPGQGLFAKALMDRGIKVIDAEDI